MVVGCYCFTFNSSLRPFKGPETDNLRTQSRLSCSLLILIIYGFLCTYTCDSTAYLTPKMHIWGCDFSLSSSFLMLSLSSLAFLNCLHLDRLLTYIVRNNLSHLVLSAANKADIQCDGMSYFKQVIASWCSTHSGNLFR